MNKKRIRIFIVVALIIVLFTTVALIAVRTSIKNTEVPDEYVFGEWGIVYEEENISEDDEKSIDLEIQSNVIKNLIQNDWNISDVSLGERESTYRNFDVYFDEGIEAKTIAGKVFNIVFTKKYTKNIANGLNTSSTKNEVVRKLGNPEFELEKRDIDIDEEFDIDPYLIGYKSEYFYIFFSNWDVSIYPVMGEYDKEKLSEAFKSLSENKDIAIFAKNITEVWNDFDYYNTTNEHIDIKHTLRGFRVRWGFNNENGITLYKNTPKEVFSLCNQTDEVKNIVIDETDINSVFEEENERYMNSHPYYMSGEPLGSEIIEGGSSSKEFSLCFFTNERGDINRVVIYSIKGNYPNREIQNENIYKLIWENDSTFFYSVKNNGIYKFNCITGTKNIIIEGNREYNIQKIEDGYLFFDNFKIRI